MRVGEKACEFSLEMVCFPRIHVDIVLNSDLNNKKYTLYI